MLQISIKNITPGNKKIANYDFGVYVNYRIIAHGHIKNYERSRGWQGLLLEIADIVENSTVSPPKDLCE